ncbi:MAG: HEAT repeat domain-containing protein [Myxococcota bacterium]
MGAGEATPGSWARRTGFVLLALAVLGGLVFAATAYREKQYQAGLSAEMILAETRAELNAEGTDPRRVVDRVLLAARRATERDETAERDHAIELLGRIDDPYLIEALVRLLEDPDPRMRQLAAQTLGSLRDAKATDALVVCLGDEDLAVFESALEALRRIHPRRANVLFNAYGADADLVRRHHTLALVDILDPRLGQALVEALSSEHPEVRRRAFHVAALSGAPEQARAAVEQALEDPDAEVRQLAVKIAGRTGGELSLDSLLTALGSDQSPSVRRELFEAIERAAYRSGPERLVAALESDEPAVREASARALSRFDGDATAVEGLVKLLIAGLSHEVEFVTLSHGGTRRHTAQLAPDLRAALESLHEIGRSAGVSLLIRKLAVGTSLERRGAALALEAIEDPEAVESLAAALTARDPVLRVRAASALGVLDDARAIGPLVDAFAASRRGEVELRETVHWALVRLTGSNYGPQPDPWIRWWARNGSVL